MSVWTRAYLGLVVFSLAGSLLSRVAHLDPGPIAPVAALLTLLFGTYASLKGYLGHNGPQGWGVALGVLVLGAGVELTGVATGYPFGRYRYTDHWWPTVTLERIGHFPLLVPVAWLLVVGSSTLAASAMLHAPRSRGPLALASGLLAAVLDLAMEPVMAGPLDYWRWEHPSPLPGGAPLLNFVGWFVTASAGAAILLRGGEVRVQDARDSRWVLLGHVALTLGIGAILSGLK